MRKLFKYFVWTSLCVLSVAAFVGIGVYIIFKNSVAPNEGEFRLSGLAHEVSVVKDAHNVPHIIANDRIDAVRTLGYLHASERLWQMEVMRMAGQGRLSELFGEATVGTDIFIQTLDFVTPSKNSLNVLSDETITLLEAYSAGVNAFIERDVEGFTPRLQPEFMIIGHTPEKWESWHSLVILKVMALTLDHNMDKEIGRLALAKIGFTPKEIEQIYLYNKRDVVEPLPDLRQFYGFTGNGRIGNTTNVSLTGRGGQHKAEIKLAWDINVSASNSWVISGSRTRSGMPLMANDPHLALTTPSTFYLAHLKFNNKDVLINIIGGTLPGTPLFLVGRNDSVSWGLTTTRLDSQDIYLEQLNPENFEEYRVGEEVYQAFEKQEKTILVKGNDAVNFVRRSTRNGPILPETYKKLSKRLPSETVAALRWTALDNDDTTIEGALDISMARDVADLIVKTRKLVSPMQSIVAADKRGNIGLIAAGRVPIRSKENKIKGRAPVPGWIDEYQWQGYLPFAELPRIINPKSGALVTANSNWLPRDYPHHITYDWSEDYRQARAEQLYLASSILQDPVRVAQGMGDDHSAALVSFRDIGFEQFTSDRFLSEHVLLKLRDWNGRMSKDAAEPLIMTNWVKHVNKLMFEDDLGDEMDLVNDASIERILNILTKANERNWCNKFLTAKLESCGHILAEGLELAIAELEELYGFDVDKWRWGNAHKSLHEHRPFSKVGALSGFFTTRPEIGGGRYTLLRSKHKFSNDDQFAAVTGAAYRAIYDFSDLNKSGYINSTGQSGNIMSKYYDDLSAKWGNLEYLKMTTDAAEYSKQVVGKLKFVPASAQ